MKELGIMDCLNRMANVLLLILLLPITLVMATWLAGELRTRKDSHCMSNLKQIGTALSLYEQDNDNKYPMAFACSGLTKGTIPKADSQSPNAAGLMRVLINYYKDPEIWVCPAGAKRDYNASECKFPKHGNRRLVGWMPLPDGKIVYTNYISYPLNTELGDSNKPNPEYCRGWSPEKATKKWGHIYSPNGLYRNTYHPYPAYNNRLIQDGYITSDSWRPHHNSINTLYHDGHVARLRNWDSHRCEDID